MDNPPKSIHRLSIARSFQTLSSKEKLYAHFLARAAWHGSKIILQQVSPEAPRVFDMILESYQSVSGDWNRLVEERTLEKDECDAFLDYAATFLSNIGNYYGHGDQKFVPRLPIEALKRLANRSTRLTEIFSDISEAITSIPPYCLGYNTKTSQSSYYLGAMKPTKEEIAMVSRVLEDRLIYPENTRIRKTVDPQMTVFEVLIASIEKNKDVADIPLPLSGAVIRLVFGDHMNELTEVCSSLRQAINHASNEKQKKYLAQLIRSFESGSLDDYRAAQFTWIEDKSPRIENIFGFVEPYRDPYGIRAEFEGLVAVNDPEETDMLRELVQRSSTFIKRLPWARTYQDENDGKGPFEKELFEPPDFSSINALAYCSSIIFPGINLPNYNDIRDQSGFKNVIIANRMCADGNSSEACPFIKSSEIETFNKHKGPAYYWWVVLHELFGHGTGKMMVEESSGKYNFNYDRPPTNPLTEKPITSWYKPGETWTGKFGDIATSVDECRAELVGACLMDDKELLNFFGFSETTDITANELTYNTYLQIGVDGLRALANYNTESEKWGQAHSRAHFAMLKWLLSESKGCLSIDFDFGKEQLIVNVNQTRIRTGGKPALEKMLLILHMYRCTANAESCRSYYENLSAVDDEQLKWREIVLSKKQPKKIFVQANTFNDEGEITLKEYAPSMEGIIQSWAERGLEGSHNAF